MNITDPCYFNPADLPNEIWKDISEFENEYEVSTEGRIRSKERYIFKCTGSIAYHSPRILTPYNVNKHKRNIRPSYVVTLASGGRTKHHYCRGLKKLIVDTFLIEPENKEEFHLVCIDDDLDFKLDNLMYISTKEYFELYPTIN